MTGALSQSKVACVQYLVYPAVSGVSCSTMCILQYRMYPVVSGVSSDSGVLACLCFCLLHV